MILLIKPPTGNTIMKTESTKKDFIAYLGALHGAKWMDATNEQRKFIWDDAMALRKACGNKTWSFSGVRELITLQTLNSRAK